MASSPSSSKSSSALAAAVDAEELSADELEEIDDSDFVEVEAAGESGDLSIFDSLVERRPVTQPPRATPIDLSPPPAYPSFTATSVGIASPMPPAVAPNTVGATIMGMPQPMLSAHPMAHGPYAHPSANPAPVAMPAPAPVAMPAPAPVAMPMVVPAPIVATPPPAPTVVAAPAPAAVTIAAAAPAAVMAAAVPSSTVVRAAPPASAVMPTATPTSTPTISGMPTNTATPSASSADDPQDTVVLTAAEIDAARGANEAATVVAPPATTIAAAPAPAPAADLTSLVDDDGPGDTVILPSSELQAAQAAQPPATGAPAPLALADTQAARRAAQPASTPLPAARPMAPSISTMPPQPRPTSIPPMAFDVATGPRHVDGTVRMAPMTAAQASAATRPRTSIVALASAAFVAAFAAAVVVALAMGNREEGAAAAAARPAPRTVEIARATSGSLEEPATAPTKDPALTGETEPAPAATSTTTSLAAHVDHPSGTSPNTRPLGAPPATAAAPAPAPAPAPATHTSTSHAAANPTTKPAPATKPQPAAAPAPAPTTPPAPVVTAAPPPPAPAAPVASTGTVVVDAELKTVLVDGDYKRVSGGRVVLPCGRHRIRAGLEPLRTIDVPCGGTVSLQ